MDFSEGDDPRSCGWASSNQREVLRAKTKVPQRTRCLETHLSHRHRSQTFTLSLCVHPVCTHVYICTRPCLWVSAWSMGAVLWRLGADAPAGQPFPRECGCVWASACGGLGLTSQSALTPEENKRTVVGQPSEVPTTPFPQFLAMHEISR